MIRTAWKERIIIRMWFYYHFLSPWWSVRSTMPFITVWKRESALQVYPLFISNDGMNGDWDVGCYTSVSVGHAMFNRWNDNGIVVSKAHFYTHKLCLAHGIGCKPIRMHWCTFRFVNTRWYMLIAVLYTSVIFSVFEKVMIPNKSAEDWITMNML